MLTSSIVPSAAEQKEWARDTINHLVRMVGLSGTAHRKDKLCYDIYYSLQDEQDFNYLTGTDEFRMPAKIRFLPVVRPFFDLLVSTEEMKPWEAQVYSVDTASMDEKKKRQVSAIMSAGINRIMQAQQRIGMAKMRIDAIKKQHSAQGQDDPMAGFRIRQMELELSTVEQALARGGDLIDADLAELERQSRLTDRTQLEVNMTNALEFLNQKQGLKDTFNEGFRDLLIVDNEVYRIEDVYEGQDPSIRKVNPLFFYYLSSMDATWTDEVPAVLEERWMTVQQIIDEYGDRMSDEELGRLKDGPGWETGRMEITPAHAYSRVDEIPLGGAEQCGPDTYAGSTMYSADMIPVRIVEWRASRRITFKESPNKHDPDLTHLHLVRDEKLKVGKDEKLRVKYMSEWWGGVRIGQDIFVDVRKLPFQNRDSERLGKCFGRYVGFAYNGIDRRPYSRVWAVKDIQILYNLLYYQLELLIVLSGIKGVIVDKAQIPEGMKFEDWYKWLKMGVGFIDSMKKQPGGRIGTSFNQFQTFDLTFGNSIAQVIGMMDKLEVLAGRVIGIPPQRLGEMSASDQVGTAEQARQQSSLVTETLFYKHRRVVKRVMNRYINALQHAWKKGRRGQYVTGSAGQKSFEIAADSLTDAGFEVFFGGSAKDDKVMEMALQAMTQNYIAGGSSLAQLIEAYRMNGLNELQESVQYYEKIARQQFEQGAQSQQQSEQETLRMKGEIDALVKKQASGGEQLGHQIDQVKLQLEQQRMMMEAQVQNQVAGMKADATKYVSDNNTRVEAAYLQEQARKTDLEGMLRRLELALDRASESGNISSGRSKERIKD